VHCRRDTITSIADAFASSVGIGLFTETVASSWWRGPVGAATASEGHVVDHHQLALISPWGRKCTERRGDIWLFGCGRNGGRYTKNAPQNDQPTDAAGPIKKIDACGGHQNWGS
jgi:hypothetical protein